MEKKSRKKILVNEEKLIEIIHNISEEMAKEMAKEMIKEKTEKILNRLKGI